VRKTVCERGRFASASAYDQGPCESQLVSVFFLQVFSWLIKNRVTDVLLFLDIVCVASVGLVLPGCVLYYFFCYGCLMV